MADPSVPQNLDLFGSNQNEQENSRGATSLRVDWSTVANAVAYDLNVNGVLIPDRAPGTVIDQLSPNTEYHVEVRARSLDGSASAFSTPLVCFTRPPTPDTPRLSAASDARTEQGLRIEFDLVPGDSTFHYAYDLEVDDIDDIHFAGVLVLTSFTSGDVVGILSAAPAHQLEPNVRYAIRVRARDDARGAAGFFSASPGLQTATRPPVPTGLVRVPYDAPGMHPILAWSGVAGFHQDADATTEVGQIVGSSAITVVDVRSSTGAGMFVDYGPLQGYLRQYFVRISALLPGFGANESLWSPGIAVLQAFEPAGGLGHPEHQLRTNPMPEAIRMMRSYYEFRP